MMVRLGLYLLRRWWHCLIHLHCSYRLDFTDGRILYRCAGRGRYDCEFPMFRAE